MEGSPRLPPLKQKKPLGTQSSSSPIENYSDSQLKGVVREFIALRLQDENRIDQINDKILLADDEIKNLEDQQMDLKQKLSNFNQTESDAFESSKEEINKQLSYELSKLSDELISINKEKYRLEKENSRLQFEIQDAIDKTKLKKDPKKVIQQKSAELDVEIQDLNEQILVIESHNSFLLNRDSIAMNQRNRNQEIHDLRNELNNKEQILNDIQAQIDQLKKEIEAIEINNKGPNQEIAELKKKIEEQESKNNNLTFPINQLQILAKRVRESQLLNGQNSSTNVISPLISKPI